MKLKLPRITIRRLIVLIALVAISLAFYREFEDGLPPRFVVRAIPARVAQLKPGMTMKQTREILGLDRPWYRGGLMPNRQILATNDGELFLENCILGRTSMYQPSRHLRDLRFLLGFRSTRESGTPKEKYESATLESASFTSDDRTIAEMPSVNP